MPRIVPTLPHRAREDGAQGARLLDNFDAIAGREDKRVFELPHHATYFLKEKRTRHLPFLGLQPLLPPQRVRALSALLGALPAHAWGAVQRAGRWLARVCGRRCRSARPPSAASLHSRPHARSSVPACAAHLAPLAVAQAAPKGTARVRLRWHPRTRGALLTAFASPHRARPPPAVLLRPAAHHVALCSL